MTLYSRKVALTVAMLALVACSEQGMQAGASSDGPAPLPSATIYQNHQGPARSERTQIILQPGERTEVKALLQQDQVITYQWVSNLPVYVDFHGHEPDESDVWYRYREQQAGMSSFGSLVAPVSGEHGWYYRNDNPSEITIDLRVDGYFDGLRDLGVFPPEAESDHDDHDHDH